MMTVGFGQFMSLFFLKALDDGICTIKLCIYFFRLLYINTEISLFYLISNCSNLVVVVGFLRQFLVRFVVSQGSRQRNLYNKII